MRAGVLVMLSVGVEWAMRAARAGVPPAVITSAADRVPLPRYSSSKHSASCTHHVQAAMPWVVQLGVRARGWPERGMAEVLLEHNTCARWNERRGVCMSTLANYVIWMIFLYLDF